MSDQNEQPIAPSEVVDPSTNRPVAPQLSQGEIIPQREQALANMQRLLDSRRSVSNMPAAKIPDALREFIENPPRPTFPEPLFVQYFLPYFAGTAGPESQVDYTTWIQKVSGGDSIAVDIIDENGTVLFTVPPLLERAGIVTNTSGKSMTIIERQYSRRMEIDVQGGQNLLVDSLNDLYLPKEQPDQMLANTRAWNDIFRRYGLDHLINPIFKESAEGAAPTNGQQTQQGQSDVASGGLEFD